MTDEARIRLLSHCGFRIVREETLPPGPYIAPEEVGEPGPWFGVQAPDGKIIGWERGSDALNCWSLAWERYGEQAIKKVLEEAGA